jgi:hypothetical protein
VERKAILSCARQGKQSLTTFGVEFLNYANLKYCTTSMRITLDSCVAKYSFAPSQKMIKHNPFMLESKIRIAHQTSNSNNRNLKYTSTSSNVLEGRFYSSLAYNMFYPRSFQMICLKSYRYGNGYIGPNRHLRINPYRAKIHVGDNWKFGQVHHIFRKTLCCSKRFALVVQAATSTPKVLPENP